MGHRDPSEALLGLIKLNFEGNTRMNCNKKYLSLNTEFKAAGDCRLRHKLVNANKAFG